MKAIDPNVSSQTDGRLTLRVAAIACIVSCFLVALDLWVNRELFDPEGITYLDMADAYLRGDWRAALIGLWSPLYPWLLALMMFFFNPSPQWEFTAVHAFNYVVYLVTLGSFSLFMWEFLRARKETDANGRLPDWAWIVLGYSLFAWSTIRLIPPYLPEPDSIVCALVYVIFAILFRMRNGPLTWRDAVSLGVLLGAGYLTKAIMFPMAFVFTGVALMSVGGSTKNRYKILTAFSVFLLLSLPYVVVLSDANDRWMFSDAGRLNYAWEINQVKKLSHWQGEEVIYGTPVHPTRKIHDNPPMYEFGTPFKVTYPPWYDPSYWYEGVKVTWDLQKQLSVIVRNTTALSFFLANSTGPAGSDKRAYYVIDNNLDTTIGSLLTLFCAMIVMTRGRVSVFRRIAEHWFVLVPIGAILGAYALLHFEGRYIAAYIVVLWMVLFRSVAIPHSEESKRILTAVLVSAALITAITLARGTGRAVFHAARYVVNGNTEAPFLQSGYANWKVAKYLYDAGLGAGDRVGAVGWTYSAYWARMARVHIVAEVPDEVGGAKTFWSWEPAKRAKIMQLFRDLGVKAVVVSEGVPSDSAPENWQHIGDTNYHVYVFPSDESYLDLASDSIHR